MPHRPLLFALLSLALALAACDGGSPGSQPSVAPSSTPDAVQQQLGQISEPFVVAFSSLDALGESNS